MAANKSDLVAQEEVSEDEAREFAKNSGLVFRCTSACTAAGIDELFRTLGCKYLDPNYVEGQSPSGKTQAPVEKTSDNQKKIKLDAGKVDAPKKKKKCC